MCTNRFLYSNQKIDFCWELGNRWSSFYWKRAREKPKPKSAILDFNCKQNTSRIV